MAVNNLNTPGVGIQPSIVDAKGDLIAGTAADAVGRLAVGTNGQQLVADSTASTGLKWDNPSGLVHIETQTISGTPSAINFNNVFSSTYDNYEILLTIQGSANNNAELRLRSSGTDDTGTNYRSVFVSYSATTVAVSTLNTTSITVGVLRLSDKSLYSVKIANPFLAEKTLVNTTGTRTHDAIQGYNIFGQHMLDTSYDGFTLFASSGTFNSGEVSVYGYRK